MLSTIQTALASFQKGSPKTECAPLCVTQNSTSWHLCCSPRSFVESTISLSLNSDSVIVVMFIFISIKISMEQNCNLARKELCYRNDGAEASGRLYQLHPPAYIGGPQSSSNLTQEPEYCRRHWYVLRLRGVHSDMANKRPILVWAPPGQAHFLAV